MSTALAIQSVYKLYNQDTSLGALYQLYTHIHINVQVSLSGVMVGSCEGVAPGLTVRRCHLVSQHAGQLSH